MRARVAAAALLVGALTSWAPPADAAPKWMEADEHFRHGVALFKENNYRAALVEFQRAYEIDPKFQVLYNIGESQYQLQDYASALKTFERYLAEGGAKIGVKRKKDVEAEIVTLKGRVATIEVAVNEPGAIVAIDDVEIGKSPLEPITVSAGRRKITASLSGRVPVTQVVDVAGGDQKTIRLEIAPLATEKPEKPEKPRPPAPSPVAPIVTWSATGALAIGAVVTGVLALGASQELTDELERYPADPDKIDGAHGRAFTLGLTTDILIGTSVAAAGVAIYFTVDWSMKSDEAAAPTRPAARLVVRPGGLALDGTF